MNKQDPGIEYMDYDCNIVTGCKHREMGICRIEDCWARRMAHRQRNNPKSPYSKWGFEPHFYPERLAEPLLKKESLIIGLSYMGDMWGDFIPAEWIEQTLDMCKQAHWHRFLLLTKNPKRFGEFEIPQNCWCGTSIDGYDKANNDRSFDLWHSSMISRKFISLEPYTGYFPIMSCLYTFNWLIVGGLTGKGATRPHKLSVDEIIMECGKRELPLFLKSNTGYPDYKNHQEWPEGLRL